MDDLGGQVVVGYDGSPQSCAAVDWAAAEAHRRNVPLLVLHALDHLGLMPNTIGPTGWPTTFADEGVRIATAGADRARKHGSGMEVRSRTEITSAARALVQASASAALLVVGTHGCGARPGVLLGSVAFAVTAHAHCPVVVVRGDSTRRAGPDRPVVVGFDGSSGSAAAVRYAADVAASTGAPLTLITAYRPAWPWILSGADYLSHPSEGRPDFEAMARATARHTAIKGLRVARQQHPGLTAAQRTIRGPAAGILAGAARRAGLLVVGFRGHGGFTGLVLGSVSHRVIQAATCPVAVVHGGIPETEAQSALAFSAGPT
jgi:nucleotide-binding universal stress UspA family protein